MLWLDEDLWVNAQTPAQGSVERELDVPTDGNGLQHHPTESLRVIGGNLPVDYRHLRPYMARES